MLTMMQAEGAPQSVQICSKIFDSCEYAIEDLSFLFQIMTANLDCVLICIVLTPDFN